MEDKSQKEIETIEFYEFPEKLEETIVSEPDILKKR